MGKYICLPLLAGKTKGEGDGGRLQGEKKSLGSCLSRGSVSGFLGKKGNRASPFLLTVRGGEKEKKKG